MANWNLVDASLDRWATENAIGVSLQTLDGHHWGRNEDRRFIAASTIKIPVMIELFRQIDAGNIKLGRLLPIGDSPVPGSGVLQHLRPNLEVTVEEACVLMIAISDNVATNLLVDLVGLDAVNRTIDSIGMTNSHMGRKMLGQRAKTADDENWYTVNEPWVASFLAYGLGIHAPGKRDHKAMLAVAHNLLRAHGQGVAAVRANAPGGQVGLVINSSTVRPVSPSGEDQAAVTRWDGFLNRWFLDPVVGRGYPADMVEAFGAFVPTVQPGDFELIAQPTDFLALNYYMPDYVRADPSNPLFGVSHADAPAEFPRMSNGWPVDPSGLSEMLIRMHRDYAFPKLYVAENGGACDDPQPTDGHVADPERTQYLESHLGAVRDAMDAGAPMAGYFVWSLLDNFEWSAGYAVRFGIVHVDFATQARTIKDSGRRYAEIIATNH